MGRVEGKIALVTGGGSGIGEATAKLLAAEGAAVGVADLRVVEADRVVAEIAAAGGRATAIEVDVSDEAQVRAMVEATVDAFGGLDVLHNNAAITEAGAFARDGAVTDMDVDVWDRIMAVNLRGPMLGCKHAIPRMRERGGGSIVNMSSTSSRLGDLTRTGYGASKAGVNALTVYVATQFGPERIRANTILPGPIFTPAAAANVAPEFEPILRGNVLTPYLGEPDDIAYLVLYLASDESKFVTGQAFPVNGGLDCHQPHYAQRIKILPPIA